MKKIFVVLMSLVFVLGAVSFVVADDAGMDSVRAMAPGAKVILGGDAYVRGLYFQNFDGIEGDDNDNRYFDQRVRLKVNALVGDGIEVRNRIVLFGNEDGDEAVLDSNTARDNYTVDYSYLHVPVGSVTIDTGIMKRSFGNRLNIWDERNSTLQASMAFGNANVSAFLDKIEETEDTGDENLDDYDRYGVSVTTDVNGMTLGAMIRVDQDNRNSIVNEDDVTVLIVDDSGFDVDLFVNAKAGNLDIAAEFAYEGGDMNEDTEDNAGMGAFVSVSTPIDQLTVGGTLAYAANGFDADDHFNPTLLIGTDQGSALLDFGAIDDESSFGVVAAADYAVSSDLAVNAKLAYYSFGDPVDDATLTEVDAGLAYQLGDNAQYVLNLAYGSIDKFTADDDSPMFVGHAIEMWF